MLILFYNRMFGQVLDLENHRFPPEFEFTEDRRRFSDADAVIFHIPQLLPFFWHRKPRGQIWVAWSMECEEHYPRLRDVEFMSRFDLTMTYRQNADVFISYIPKSLSVPPFLPVQEKRHEKLICSFISSRFDRSGRKLYLKELCKYVNVHRYGRRGNRKIQNDEGRSTRLRIAGSYKFTFEFESAIAEDYVTEKLYDPLVAGSVPVYMGAPNVNQYAPTSNCFINVRDYSGPAELAEYLLELDSDDQAYDRYMNWRERPTNPEFERLRQRLKPRALERLCQNLLQLRAVRYARCAESHALKPPVIEPMQDKNP